MDRWMTCNLYIILNSILVLSWQWDGDNERLCAMEPCLHIKRFLPLGIKLGTARSAGQPLIHPAIEAPLKE